jgi:hypothetical protein
MRAIGKTLAALCIAGTSILSCRDDSSQSENIPQSAPPVPKYFAELPAKSVSYSSSTIAIASGDFDNDGYLDIVVGITNTSTDKARLYFFKGSGKGNFTQGSQ